jgi:ABC-type multidrug transport system fused ATPase/permease subunit
VPIDADEDAGRVVTIHISPVIIRVGVTLAIGGLSFLLSNAAGQSTESTVTVSVLVGGVVLVVQYLAGFEGRLEALGVEQRRTLAGMNAATRLYDQLKRSPIDVADLERLVESMITIRSLGIQMISDLTMAEFVRLAQFVEEIRVGEASYEGEDREWLLGLTRAAQGDIVATSSTLVDDGFWETELGDRYMKAQIEAVERGVRVRRLFIIDDRRTSDQSFSVLIQRQKELKMEVRTLVFDNLSTIQRNSYRDFVVFDKRLYYQVQSPPKIGTASSQAAVVETRLTVRAEDVESAMVRFEELWDLADDVS